MIFKKEDDDGRQRVTEEEERITIKGESTYQISEIARLSSNKNFICKRKNVILNMLIDFEPV